MAVDVTLGLAALSLLKSVLGATSGGEDEAELLGALIDTIAVAREAAATDESPPTDAESVYVAHVFRAFATALRALEGGASVALADAAAGETGAQRALRVASTWFTRFLGELSAEAVIEGRLRTALEAAADVPHLERQAHLPTSATDVYRCLLDLLQPESGSDDALLPRHGARAVLDHRTNAAFSALLTSSTELQAAVTSLRGQAKAEVWLALMEAQARFGERHVFGNVRVDELRLDDLVPPMPLSETYVEPDASIPDQRSQFRRVADAADPGAIAKIDALLDAGAKVVFVEQAFGHGKSLTARWLAMERSQQRLNGGEEECLFATCFSGISAAKGIGDFLGRTVGRTTQAVLGPHARSNTELPPRGQPCLFIVDGLDESGMGAEQVRALLDAMLDASDDQWRFVVFTRPAAISALEVDEDEPVASLKLEPFDPAQRMAWLDRWVSLPDRDASVKEQLTERVQADDLYSSPVLLFMAAVVAEYEPDVLGDRVALFEHFCAQVAASKCRIASTKDTHRPVREAARRLFAALDDAERMTVPAPDSLSDDKARIEADRSVYQISERDEAGAMLWALSRIAWHVACEWQRGGGHRDPESSPGEIAIDEKTVGRLLVDALPALKDLDPSVFRSVLLASQGCGDDGQHAFMFGHRSFIEYLSVRYWLSELLWMLPRKQTDEDVVRVIRTLGEGDILDLSDAAQEFCDGLWPLLAPTVGPESNARQLVVEQLVAIIDDPTMIPPTGACVVTLDSDPRLPVRWFAMAAAGAVSTGISRPGGWDSPPVSRVEVIRWRAREVPTLLRASAIRVRSWGALKLPGIDASDMDLSAVVAPRADLSFADLRGAVLACAVLTQATLHGANLEGAKMRGVWLGSTLAGNCTLTGADLRGAYLCFADLQSANLSAAVASEANFSIANLEGARLRGANIGDADFSMADLTGADLRGCTLIGSSYPNLFDVRGTHVEVDLSRRARFAGATYNRATLTDRGFDWPGDAIPVDEEPDDT